MSAPLPDGWSLGADGKSIRRVYELTGFAAAVALVNAIAARAEAADHHPDLHLTRYRRLEVALTTHDAGGVTEKDYRLAAEIEALPKETR
ncbi:MAG: 4a-hydroxytetrahydrobiopterin dehydratase [Elusimicrobia bacterium]|nr:4a-hydroxytetrahydrobiopterin dehydratase [Elusimicrobiota bacterium]